MAAICRLDENIMAQTLRFIDTWGGEDAYRRFGSAGIDGQAWLAMQLTVHRRPAFVAVNEGHVIGLLDHVDAGGATHIGIVVDSEFRRRSIGTALVNALLRSTSVRGPVRADCDNDNVPAMALLRRCGFTPIYSDRYQTFWRQEQETTVGLAL